MRALGFDLLRQRFADLLGQRRVPRRADGYSNGKRRRLDAANKGAAAARAVRPVRDTQLADAEPGNGREGPEILAGEERDLLLQCHES